jgi:hypothetical protein
MKERIRAVLLKYPSLYRLAIFIYSPLKRLREPRLQFQDLTPSEQAFYRKLKKAFK